MQLNQQQANNNFYTAKILIEAKWSPLLLLSQQQIPKEIIKY
jgi:hypothetical protein